MVYRSDANAPEVEYIEGGIDWITATLPATAHTGDLWLQRGIHVLKSLESGGYLLKPRTLQGYYGLSAGNCFIGSREDGSMMQLTGSHANDHFASLDRPDLHYSRIDVQVTAKFAEYNPNIGKEALNYATLANEGLPTARRRKLLSISGSDGGYTFYLGSTSSDQRGRVYNKAVQSENPAYARCWRYEVVYRNDLATKLARTVPYGPDNRAKWAAQVVNSWFECRGVPNCGYATGIDAALPLARVLPTDVEKRLLWLEKQVRPAIRLLIDAGYRDTILALLGLDDPVSTNSSSS